MLTLAPRARALLITLAETVGVPHEFALGVCWGESRFDPYAVGDAGRAFGLLQMRADVWGWPGAQWQGVDGLERAIAAITPQWRRAVRPLLSEYARFSWDQQVAAFARFWQSAQRANVDAVNRQAEGALRAGRAAVEAEGMMAIERPAITWVEAHRDNYRVGRRGVSPEVIALHTMQGTLAGCDSWFRTPPSQRRDSRGNPIGPSSAHFGVGRDGTIHQYVSMGNAAISNGAEDGATAWVLRENPLADANDLTVAIEHDDEGQPGVKLPTPTQFEASCHLSAWIWISTIVPGGATNLALDRNHFARHADFAPSSRQFCPGWPESLLLDYIARVRSLVQAPVAPPSIDYRVQWIAELNGIIRAADDDILRAEVRKQDALKKLEMWK